MTTSNERLLDALVRHQIGLLRLSAGIRRQIIELLNASEIDLRAAIESKILSIAGGDLRSPITLRRLQALEKLIREIRSAAFREATALWTDEFVSLSQEEVAFLSNATKTIVPVVLELATPDLVALRAIVTTDPFEGRTLKQWARDLERVDIDRINTQIRIGVVQGETAQQITRRVFGLSTLNGTDGVTELTRNAASSITRTATNFYANAARQLFEQANADLYDEELFVATLDGRTTAVCRAQDGRRYPLGEGPRPPLHFNCRSLRVPILTPEIIGVRPFKAGVERDYLLEFAKAEGLGKITNRDSLPRGYKGMFDEWARKRARADIGQVPATTTYDQFLKRQPASFQDSVLGKTKGKLYRQGGVDLDRFVDAAGHEYTLKELAKLDRKAFIDAGLDPSEY